MSDEEIFLETGARIRALRGGISQADFAERLGVDRKTVVRWEAGERLPDGKSLLALMQVFGASASYLLDGREGGLQLADAAEQVLINAYRACNNEAKRNLIQTAALLSAGLAAGAPPEKTRSRGRPAMNPPLVKAGQSGSQGGVNKAGKGSVQAGYIGGHVTVTTHKDSKP